MKTALLALLVALLPKPLQEQKPLIDNERVTVWDVTVEKGKTTTLPRHALDAVIVDLADASVKVISQNGSAGVHSVKKGQVSFSQKGTTEKQEGVSDAARHLVMVELKDVKVAPLANKSG